MNLKTSSGLLCSLFLISCVSAMGEESQVQTNEKLRDWSIPKETRVPPKLVLSDLNGDERICLSHKVFPHDRFLVRPNDGHVVAILRFEPTGTLTLNPPGADYGPIPLLKDLTCAQAEQLWSAEPKDDVSPDGERRYLLSLDKKDCFIDLRFKNMKLQEYRVTLDSLHSQWHKVQ